MEQAKGARAMSGSGRYELFSACGHEIWVSDAVCTGNIYMVAPAYKPDGALDVEETVKASAVITNLAVSVQEEADNERT